MKLTRIEIEEIARKILKRYCKLLEVGKQREISRIDPMFIATQILNLDVDFCHLSEDGTVYGATSYYKTPVPVVKEDGSEGFYYLDGNTILIEENLLTSPSYGKLTFTIGHETAHHILRKLYPTQYGPQLAKLSNEAEAVHFYKGSEITTGSVTDWDEWQATALTAAILMPKALVLSNMKEVGLGEKIMALNSRPGDETFRKFCELADIMHVSLTALRLRMKQLGLIERDYYGKSANAHINAIK